MMKSSKLSLARLLAAACLALLAVTASLLPGRSEAQTAQPGGSIGDVKALAAALSAGGHVILVRHGRTTANTAGRMRSVASVEAANPPTTARPSGAT